MPVRRTLGLASALSALVLAGLPIAAYTVPISGCDLDVDDGSPACLAFDSNGDGWVNPDIEITWPSAEGLQAGAWMTVSAQGADLLRPVTVDLFRAGNGAPVASLTVGPGALTASVPVPTGAAGPAEFSARAEDDDMWLYVYDSFEPVVTALSSSLTADLPPGRVVKSGARTQHATGRVSGGARPVHLEVRARDGAWVTVAATTSRADGAYTLGVPNVWVGKHSYRVQAPAHGSFAAAVGSRTGSVTVKRTYKPRGSKAHTFLFGRGSRWNACTPIRYALNTSRMPAWGKSEARYALREATAATGLRFVFGGRTSYVPFNRSRSSMLDHPDDLDLVIAWSTPRTVPGLAGGTIGLGGAQTSGRTLFNGGVVLDVTASWSRKIWRETMLHEVGHALGLGHVADRQQVMVSGASGRNLRYNNGDLTGLAALGAGAGACTGAPDVFLRGVTGVRRAADATVRQVVMP